MANHCANGLASAIGNYRGAQDIGRKDRTVHGNTRHGHTTRRHGRSSEYSSWRAMLSRCNDPRHKSYSLYGGAGIWVAPRWLDFIAFLEDMGAKPSPKHSLDRIDNARALCLRRSFVRRSRLPDVPRAHAGVSVWRLMS